MTTALAADTTADVDALGPSGHRRVEALNGVAANAAGLQGWLERKAGSQGRERGGSGAGPSGC